MKNVCSHNRQKSHCKDCGGVGICKHNRRRWDCRFCEPLKWAKKIIAAAKYRNRRVENITAEKLVQMMQASCVLCEQPLNWLEVPSPHLHHSHLTGKIVGFAHGKCNRLEGFILALSVKARRVILRKFL